MMLRSLHATISSTEELIEEARNGRHVHPGRRRGPRERGRPRHPGAVRDARGDQLHGPARPRPDLPGADPAARRAARAAADERRPTARATRPPSPSRSRRARASPPASPRTTARTPSRSPSTRECGRDDIVTPGHVFPLVAREGGALVRAGHTEAAVDIARLAGLNPSGVICEIMNDDGTMARLPDLVAFAQLHDLKLGTIADLIAYRRRTERLVKRVQEGRLDARDRRRMAGDGLCQHRRLCRASGAGEGRCRRRPSRCWCACTRSMCWTTSLAGTSAAALHAAMRMIAADGRGVVVLLRENRATKLSERVGALTASPRPPGAVARLRHRRADPARSRRARHGAAVEHAAHHHRPGRLRAEHRRAAAAGRARA